MLEAILIIRRLWEGKMTKEWGAYFTVVDARLYSVPAEPPSVYVAGSRKRSAEMAGRLGDGFIGFAARPLPHRGVDRGPGADKPHYAEVQVCWA